MARLLTSASNALSADFCPSANRWVYWLKNPFWILLLAVIGSATCGAFLNPWILALTALLLAVVAVGTVLPWVAMKGVSCEVMFDVRRVPFGEPALVRLNVRNRWPLPVWGLSLVNGFTNSAAATALTDSDDGIAFARVPGRSTVEHSWRFVAPQRGAYPVNGRAEVETSFPFGLFRARREVRVTGKLIVWPQTVALPNLPDVAETSSVDDSFSDRRVGDFGDMLGTRLFREGDSLRRVHWAQTARQQTLIVTERQAPLTTSVRVVLDFAREPAPPLSSPRRFSEFATIRGEVAEQCIRVAASLCESLHRQHCRVELLIGDRLLVVGNSAAGLDRAMDALATLDCDQHVTTANAAHSGRSPEFTITVTNADNAVPGRRRQIVVVDTDAIVNADAWILLNTKQPLCELASVWRKVCHD
ncbi:MAG: DUF58 domain-containing protein [Fuerstiella sp.]